MTRTELHRLVDDLPDDVVEGTVTLLRKVVLRQIDPDQLWFWMPDWQEGEREADAQIAAGEGTIYRSDEEFLAHLDSIPPAPG